MEFNLWHVGAIVAVGFAQGFLNIVAGGGAFLVLPMLTFLGMDLAMANGTNRIAILLQSVSGATSFHRDKILSLRSALPLALVATLGATAGAFTAVKVDKATLNIVVAGLISVMAVLLLGKPEMWEGRKDRRWPRWMTCALFAGIGFYGGFIQAGAGLFISWGLAAAAGVDLVEGNAIKSVIIGCYTAVSLAIFFVNGMVDPPVGLVLAVGSVMGAWVGAKFTVAKGNRWIRRILAVVVIVSAAKMIGDVL